MVSQDLLVSGQDLKSIVSSDQYAWGDLEISWEMVQAKFDGITFQQIKEPIEFPLYLLCKIQWQTKHRECTVVGSGHLPLYTVTAGLALVHGTKASNREPQLIRF